jgi:iduronate 2-sulfatase
MRNFAAYKRTDSYRFLYIKYTTIIVFCLSLFAFKKQSKPLNILFITIDDLRPELGCFGSGRVVSPNIDKLASEGSVFMNAYCNSAVCGPSRASLLSGVRPIPGKRFKDWNCRIDEEGQGVITLPQHFKNAGYHTVSNGKFMHVQDDSPEAWSEPAWRSEGNRGAGFHTYNDYRDWVDPVSAKWVNDKKGPFYEYAEVNDTVYHDGVLTEKTINDLRRISNCKDPFFLAVGFWRPHLPFNAPKEYWDLYDSEKIPLATNRFTPENAPDLLNGSTEILGQYTANSGFPDADGFHRLAVHGYLASVSYIDAQVGKIMDELKALGLWDNTIVILLGDNGFHLGEHNFWGKHNTMDVSVKVPLIIRCPGYKPNRLKQNIEFVDIYPGVCELASMAIPAHCVGKSLAPVMKNPKLHHKQYIYPSYGNACAIKYKHFLYTEWDGGAEKMLFNHKTDPQENFNIVSHSKYKKVVETLHNKLDDLRLGW